MSIFSGLPVGNVREDKQGKRDKHEEKQGAFLHHNPMLVSFSRGELLKENVVIRLAVLGSVLKHGILLL